MSMFVSCITNDFMNVWRGFREEDDRWPFRDRTRRRRNLWRTVETGPREIGARDNEMAGIRVKTGQTNKTTYRLLLGFPSSLVNLLSREYYKYLSARSITTFQRIVR